MSALIAGPEVYQLGPHFTLGELVRSDVAIAHQIDNWPHETVIVARLQVLVREVLESVRGKFGVVRITSGYRCEAVNRLVGGKPDSQHLTGEAADIVCPAIDTLGLAQWIERALVFDQLILEPGWVHVSYALHGQRRQALRRAGDGYAIGLVA